MQPRPAIAALFVFVLLGALATVLSSWAIHGAQWLARDRATGGPLAMWHSGLTPMPPEAWPAVRTAPRVPVPLERTFVQSIFTRAQAGIGWFREKHEARSLAGRGPTPSTIEETLVRTTIGWPWPALRRDAYEARNTCVGLPVPYPVTPAVSWLGGIEVGVPRQSLRSDRFALPLLPLWPGFLINIVFYAILAFALMRTPRVLHRGLRRRRGRCERCGYDRQGLDAEAACPECGAGAAIGIRHSAIGKRGAVTGG
ncbi:MAG: hypothetical protein RIB58_10470 [Phycisphaerales bacterium]